jgi:hypothetical protein
MMNKSTTAWVLGVVGATMYAIVVTYVVYGVWPEMHFALISVTFAVLWIGFCLAIVWAMLYRREELNTKFPISGAERRRRNKQFYDWLRSQGRR